MAWSMKHFAKISILILSLVCLVVMLAGCDTYEPQSNADDAQRYYNDKYSVSESVDESHGLGNYSLFGYNYSGSEYVMSDGVSVVYIDSEGVFRDNRQAAEIELATREFAERELRAIPGALTPVEIASVGGYVMFETYKGEGSCWAARYDGDIEAFLQAEWPKLDLQTHYSGSNYADGRFSYMMAYDVAQADSLEESYLQLGKYFDLGYVELAVVNPETFVEEQTGLFDDGVAYTVSFKGDSPESMKAVRFKPVFVKLVDGIEISSATPGVTLSEGDLRFEVLDDGFWKLHVTGEAAAHEGTMEYYVRNDAGQDITRVDGIDRFTRVCNAGEHVETSSLIDGRTYHLGDAAAIKPWIEIENMSSDRMTVRYHTYFKDQISHVDLRVIGLARKDGSTTFQSTEFPSRIVGDTSDGWLCTVDVPKGAKPDNSLSFQFTYDGDKDAIVQIQEDVALPV